MWREASIAGLCLVVGYVATRSGIGGPGRVGPRVRVRGGHLPPFLVVRLPTAQSPTFQAASSAKSDFEFAAGHCVRHGVARGAVAARPLSHAIRWRATPGHGYAVCWWGVAASGRKRPGSNLG
jgi:hypothetical protein